MTYLQTEDQRRVAQEVQNGAAQDPSKASFNLNTSLPNREGKKDIDIHLSAELLAEKAVQDLRANYPGATDAMLERVRAGIKYTAVAKAGEAPANNPERKEQLELLAKKRAILKAQAIPLAEGQMIAEPQAEALAEKVPQAISQGIAIGKATSVQLANSISTKQSIIDQYRRELSDEMAIPITA